MVWRQQEWSRQAAHRKTLADLLVGAYLINADELLCRLVSQKHLLDDLILHDGQRICTWD